MDILFLNILYMHSIYRFIQKYVFLYSVKVYGLIILKILPKSMRKDWHNVKAQCQIYNILRNHLWGNFRVRACTRPTIPANCKRNFFSVNAVILTYGLHFVHQATSKTSEQLLKSFNWPQIFLLTKRQGGCYPHSFDAVENIQPTEYYV